jgi:hypothetical protein
MHFGYKHIFFAVTSNTLRQYMYWSGMNKEPAFLWTIQFTDRIPVTYQNYLWSCQGIWNFNGLVWTDIPTVHCYINWTDVTLDYKHWIHVALDSHSTGMIVFSIAFHHHFYKFVEINLSGIQIESGRLIYWYFSFSDFFKNYIPWTM